MSSKIIFIGGPGRSGTSFVADRIGRHADVATFQDVELKIFGEFGSLLDLQSVLVRSFSPNRGEVAFKQFSNMLKAVRAGGYGQPLLNDVAKNERLDVIVGELFQDLQPKGYISQIDYVTFNSAMRKFMNGLSGVAISQKPNARYFLEKTPHNCLHPKFLNELAPNASYLHIYRNPKAIAVSLLNQSWGPAVLDHAIVWVKSYFDAWKSAKLYYGRLGLPLLDLSIEDISRDSTEYGKLICKYLNITSKDDLFIGASLDQLNGWRDKISSEDFDKLSLELDELCEELQFY